MAIDYLGLFGDWLRSEQTRESKRHAKPFAGARNIHFDGKITRQDLETNIRNDVCDLLKTPDELVKHRFLPFIRRDKRERRYRYKPNSELGHSKRYPVVKNRRLMYAGHKDACVYSFYGYILNQLYEEQLEKLELQENVLAYRPITSKARAGRNKSNVDFSIDTAQQIWQGSDAVVICTDISGFFDSIKHSVLWKEWCTLLKTEQLPAEHQAVFKSLTRFRWVMDDDIKKKLGLNGVKFKLTESYRRGVYCSPTRYNKVFTKGRLIKQNKSPAGIPQGSPISGLLSNISMLGLDVDLKELVERKYKGLYRRYSDDILIVVTANKADLVYQKLKTSLSELGLRVKDEKTDVFIYNSTSGKFSNGNHLIYGVKPARKSVPYYLGIGWGLKDRVYFKPSTLARRFRPKYPSSKKYWDYFNHAVKTSDKLSVNSVPLKRQVQKVRRSIKKQK